MFINFNENKNFKAISKPHVRKQNSQNTTYFIFKSTCERGIILFKASCASLSSKLHLMMIPKYKTRIISIFTRQIVDKILSIFTKDTVIHFLVTIHQMTLIELHRHQEISGITPTRTIRRATKLLIKLKFFDIAHHHLISSSFLHLCKHLLNVQHWIATCNFHEMAARLQSLRTLQSEFNHQILIIPLTFAIIKTIIFYIYNSSVLQCGGVNCRISNWRESLNSSFHTERSTSEFSTKTIG